MKYKLVRILKDEGQCLFSKLKGRVVVLKYSLNNNDVDSDPDYRLKLVDKDWILSNSSEIQNVNITDGHIQVLGNFEILPIKQSILIPGFNDLETYCRIHENRVDYLLKEYSDKNTVAMNSISRASQEQALWKCSKCGYEWKTKIQNRTSRGDGCPRCQAENGKTNLFIPGANDLETWANKNGMQYLLDEWSPKNKKLPKETPRQTAANAVWICRFCGKEFTMPVQHRTFGMSECPFCNRRGTSVSEKIIKNLAEQIVGKVQESRQRVDGYEIDILFPDEKIQIEYCGQYFHAHRLYHDLKKAIYLRNQGYNHIVLLENTDIEELKYDADVLNELKKSAIVVMIDRKHDFGSISATANKLRQAIEKATGKKYSNAIDISKAIVNGKAEANVRILPEWQQFAGVHPELLKEWDYEKNGNLDPRQITFAQQQKVWWKCLAGHPQYLQRIDKRHIGQGCPICAGKVITKENQLAGKYPILMRFWDYTKNDVDPYKIAVGNSTKRWFKCPNCGEERYSVPAQLVRDRSNGQIQTCKKCGMPMNMMEVPGQLQQEDPECAKLVSPNSVVKASFITPGTSRSVLLRCPYCKRDFLVENFHYFYKGRTKCPLCGRKIRSKMW